MRPPRSLSSGAFRFALVMALVFAGGAMALLVVVNRAIDHYTADAVKDGVSSEIAILLGEERQLGRVGLVDAIGRHEHAVRERQLRYLLVGRGGTFMAGSLPGRLALVGLREWRLRECDVHRSCVTPLLARGVRLDDGSILVVASDTTDLVKLQRSLSRFTIGFGLSIASLVLLGGLVTGGLFLRRMDDVNTAIDRIVAGRFAERFPRIGMGREFDRLTGNLNGMLDEIEKLMDGLRQVSVDISHDLRTPLTRLRQRLEHLQAEVPTDVGEEIQRAIAQVDQVLGIFGALLRIGAMESGAAAAHFTAVDLSELLGRVAGAYGPEIEDNGRRLETSLREGIVVEGDPELLGQAVANLIENAVAHTPAGTRIRVSLLGRPEGARVIVEDDGHGIPTDERDKVLRRFYRLDRSRSTPGVGLGLSLVAAVAALHGGSVTLEDADSGLRVALALPMRSTGA